MPYVITEACIGVKDRACVDVCPVDCIYEGEDQLYIHPDECIDCGACEPECPVTAIFPEEDVPPNLTSYIEKNRDVFASDTHFVDCTETAKQQIAGAAALHPKHSLAAEQGFAQPLPSGVDINAGGRGEPTGTLHDERSACHRVIHYIAQ